MIKSKTYVSPQPVISRRGKPLRYYPHAVLYQNHNNSTGHLTAGKTATGASVRLRLTGVSFRFYPHAVQLTG